MYVKPICTVHTNIGDHLRMWTSIICNVHIHTDATVMFVTEPLDLDENSGQQSLCLSLTDIPEGGLQVPITVSVTPQPPSDNSLDEGNVQKHTVDSS